MPRPEPAHRNARAADDGATAEQVVTHLDVRVRDGDRRKMLAHEHLIGLVLPATST
jgi:hypothetical protein